MPFSFSLVWQFILQNQFSRHLPQGVFCTRPSFGPPQIHLALSAHLGQCSLPCFLPRAALVITPSIFTMWVPSLPPTTTDFLCMEPAERERLSVCTQTTLDLQGLWLVHQPDDTARKCGQLMLSGHTLAHERQETGRNSPLWSQLCPPQGCGQLSNAPQRMHLPPFPLPSLWHHRLCTARAHSYAAVPLGSVFQGTRLKCLPTSCRRP